MSEKNKPVSRPRPLSPHLSVYKPQITSFASIIHRATGVFLSIGAVFFVWWLAALAGGPEKYAAFANILDMLIVKILLVGWAGSLIFHLLAGIRHIFWDFGVGYDLNVAIRNGWLILLLSAAATAYCAARIFGLI